MNDKQRLKYSIFFLSEIKDIYTNKFQQDDRIDNALESIKNILEDDSIENRKKAEKLSFSFFEKNEKYFYLDDPVNDDDNIYIQILKSFMNFTWFASGDFDDKSMDSLNDCFFCAIDFIFSDKYKDKFREIENEICEN